MGRIFHPLLVILANATHRDLVAQIQYLKAENEILRSKLPDRVTVTERERQRLIKLGTKTGAAIKELISIVTHRTFQRWVAASKKQPKAQKRANRKPGRPRTPEYIREQVLRIARETGWGYTRILGELKKLGIRNVSKTTVRNILKEAGLDPGPDRGKGSWDEFLRIHAQTLWACDFLSKKVWTLGGLVDYFVLVFINIETREAVATSATASPNSCWVAQQARNFVFDVETAGMRVTHLIHDWDTKFTDQFDAILESEGASIHRVGPLKPNLNAYAERFIQTIQQECLDHFVVLGEKHLNYIVREYVAHYNTERPHMALGHPPRPSAEAADDDVGHVEVASRLGDLLHHYYRAAA